MKLVVKREGLLFLLLVAVIAFAAYNTKNNLLYLMLSLAGASALVAFVSGWYAVSRLAFVSAKTPDAFAGVPFTETVSIRNRGRWLDLFGVTLEHDAASAPFVARGAELPVRVERLFRRRGVYAGEAIEVATVFPFGFFRFSRPLAGKPAITVFPRIFPLELPWLDSSRRGARSPMERKGQGEEFLRLREYVPGDHPHHVHWKTSARLDALMVREFTALDEARYCVAFVPVRPAGRKEAEFELLVSAAASLCVRFEAMRTSYRFVSGESEFPLGSSKEHTRQILVHLASVEPRASVDESLLRSVDDGAANGESVVFVAFDEVSGELVSNRSGSWTLDPAQMVHREGFATDSTRPLV